MRKPRALAMGNSYDSVPDSWFDYIGNFTVSRAESSDNSISDRQLDTDGDGPSSEQRVNRLIAKIVVQDDLRCVGKNLHR